MFYDNLKAVCQSKNLKITPTIIECGGAQGSVSNWKKGASPNSDIVARLAEYLNVSTDLLIFGHESSSSVPEDEKLLLDKYRKLSAIMKNAKYTKRILSILSYTIFRYPPEQVFILTAATRKCLRLYVQKLRKKLISHLKSAETVWNPFFMTAILR